MKRNCHQDPEKIYSRKVLDLFSTVRSSTSQESKASALEAIAVSCVLQPENIREEAAIFLIQEVVTVGNHYSALDLAIEACGPLQALSACSITLNELANENDTTTESPCALQTSLRIIRKFLLSIALTKEQIWLDSLEQSQEEMLIPQRGANPEGLVRMVVLFPVQIANACNKQKVLLPIWCVRSRFLSRLLHSALRMKALLPSDNTTITNTANTATRYVTLLVSNLVHSGSSDEVATGLYQHYEKQKLHHENRFSRDVLEILKEIKSPRELSLLLRSILRHTLSLKKTASTTAYAKLCKEDLMHYLELSCKPILECSRYNQDAWVQVMILSQSSIGADTKSNRIICNAVSHVLASCNSAECPDDDDDDDSSSDDDEECMQGKHRILQRQLYNVAFSWSERTFVNASDLTLQRHATSFILSALNTLPKHQNEANSRVMTMLMKGVGLRLESSIQDIRHDGMIIGEVVAKRLGQDLHFDELNGNREEISFLDDDLPEDKNEVPIQGIILPVVKSRRKKRNKPINPDEEYVSSDDETNAESEIDEVSCDDDSLWDDDLIPYLLEDDEEDLRSTPRPYYLRECLNLFRIDEKDENGPSQLETALQELEPLVRTKPIDLPDLAVPLTRELLRMQDTFEINRFDELRMASLVALAVHEPLSVGNCIINQMFGGDWGLSVRLDILQTIETASYELCGAKSFAAKNFLSEKPISNGKVHKNEIVESRTRRWRSLSRETVTVANRFGQVAPVWFYELVGGFVRSRDDPKLWGSANGARLLSAFMMALATIVECSGMSMGTEILAKDLIQFCWTFRVAEAAEIRRSVLFAIANSLVILKDDMLLDVLHGRSGENISDFLQRSALEDSDKTCRSLAITLSKGIGEALRSDRSLLYN